MTESKRFLRGVIHCHSRFSYDSLIPINAYLRFAERHSLDFIVLTDHDTIAGSDAHLYRSLGNAILELEDLGDLRDSILNGERRWPRLLPTSKWGIGISQLIKGWKLRDPKLGLRVLIGGFRAMLKHLFRLDR